MEIKKINFLFFLFFSNHLQSQDSNTFIGNLNKALSRSGGVDMRWEYNPKIANLKELNPLITKVVLKHTGFFEITLINYLGYHINDVTCLVLFDSTNSEITLVEPLWFSDGSARLIKKILKTKFQKRHTLILFVKELDSLMQVGSGFSMLNFKLEENYIKYHIGSKSDYEQTTNSPFSSSTVTYNKDNIYREVKITTKENGILSYEFTNPKTGDRYEIK